MSYSFAVKGMHITLNVFIWIYAYTHVHISVAILAQVVLLRHQNIGCIGQEPIIISALTTLLALLWIIIDFSAVRFVDLEASVVGRSAVCKQWVVQGGCPVPTVTVGASTIARHGHILSESRLGTRAGSVETFTSYPMPTIEQMEQKASTRAAQQHSGCQVHL